jgi:hypothetical protein
MMASIPGAKTSRFLGETAPPCKFYRYSTFENTGICAKIIPVLPQNQNFILQHKNLGKGPSVTTGTALLPSRKVPLQPKEKVDGHARLVCFASDFNFCLSWQIFKADFLNDGGELGPRPLSQERKTTRCVDLNKNPDNFFQHPGGSMGPIFNVRGSCECFLAVCSLVHKSNTGSFCFLKPLLKCSTGFCSGGRIFL